MIVFHVCTDFAEDEEGDAVDVQRNNGKLLFSFFFFLRQYVIDPVNIMVDLASASG